MDRDKRWERTKLAYDAIIEHKGIEAASPSQAVADSYAEDVADEFIMPRILNPGHGSAAHHRTWRLCDLL